MQSDRAPIVGELEGLLSVSREQVEKYMSLRSDRSVERLSKVLKDYRKSDQSSSTAKSRSTNARGTPRSSREARPTNPKSGHEKSYSLDEARQKVKELSWQSTYNNFFNSSSSHNATQKGAASAGGLKAMQREFGMRGAVGKVWRVDQKEQLTAWLKSTTDDNVQQLTELCRGICSVQAHGNKGTEYQKQFLRAPQYGLHHVVPFENKANLSSVPIGSIYRTDPWELEASEKREKQESNAMKRLTEEQGKMRNHRNLPKTVEELVFIPVNKSSRSASSDVNACFSGWPRSGGRSEYKTQYVALL